jgi:hypothetical protein
MDFVCIEDLGFGACDTRIPAEEADIWQTCNSQNKKTKPLSKVCKICLMLKGWI